MIGQSQELPAFNLLSAELIKRGDEAGAVALREKISEKNRDRAARDLRQSLVRSAAEAGDATRAIRHFEELPESEQRNFTLCVAVAKAAHQSNNAEATRKYLDLAKAEAAAPAVAGRLNRPLAYQMAQAGALADIVKLAQTSTNERTRAETLAGAVSGCVQAGQPERALELIKLMPIGQDRVWAAAALARHAMQSGRQAELGAWIDTLPSALERAQACVAAAEGCLLLATTDAPRPTAGGDPGRVFKPIDTTKPGYYADGLWSYAYELPAAGSRQGTLKYDGRDLLNPQPGDYILTPWGWMQWREKGNWLPVAEKPATGKQLPDPATHPEIISRPPPGR
jgi:hypothetical protein